ncbi:MAG: hypothetical protein A2Y62_19175 [Candidatus Fischerbacteria bacterium RBG_13_37_8]|uniref:Type II secretion system protein GspG C-terminal domain-containing protein n=1 Tax=Candidatus Fischerbacteria bacterium RBG_13_37_8 TaxID=1817863 RepID=A0A1F5VR21_9BACT|nr:MAG: hypothetical protein A2Y62_19175 [Candidatus Fischerbacteria bacterium RBG_13_37_8]
MRDATRKRPAFISALAVLNFCVAALWLIIAIIFLVEQISGLSENLLLIIICLVLATIHFFCGYWLWILQNRGRILQLVLAFAGLLFFPFGTFLSIIILMRLYKGGMKLLFSAKKSEEFSEQEMVTLKTVSEQKSLSSAVLAVILAGLNLFTLLAIWLPSSPGVVRTAHQKRTIADMRAIITGLSAYEVDYKMFPKVNSIGELERILEPVYLGDMPHIDGWGNEFRFQSWQENPASKGPDSYIIASAGQAGKWENESLDQYKPGIIQSYKNDIVVKNGVFIRRPEWLKD